MDRLTDIEREAQGYIRHSRAPTKDPVAEAYLRELGSAGRRILSLIGDQSGVKRRSPARPRSLLRIDLLPWGAALARSQPETEER